MNAVFGALTGCLVHPTSPGLLTRDGPLSACIQTERSSKHLTRYLTRSKFENRARDESPAASNHSLYMMKLPASPAILRETSEETSYQTVRLVFRRYASVTRTICTSVSLGASTRISPGFTLPGYSSPSFGSQRACSRSNSILKYRVGSSFSPVITQG